MTKRTAMAIIDKKKPVFALEKEYREKIGNENLFVFATYHAEKQFGEWPIYGQIYRMDRALGKLRGTTRKEAFQFMSPSFYRSTTNETVLKAVAMKLVDIHLEEGPKGHCYKFHVLLEKRQLVKLLAKKAIPPKVIERLVQPKTFSEEELTNILQPFRAAHVGRRPSGGPGRRHYT